MCKHEYSILLIVLGFVCAGCNLLKQFPDESVGSTANPGDVLSRDKDLAESAKEGEVPSIKDEFIENTKESGGTGNQISRDDCDAITAQAKFRYSSPEDARILVYPIDKSLVRVQHLDSGKCAVLGAIDLQKEASKFTYSENGDPLIKEVSLWSLERIEGCNGDFEYIPGCKTLAKYKKVLFVDDQSKVDDEVNRYEFSVHHRQPSASWLTGGCQLVQGDDEFNCKKYSSLLQVKKYREYIVSGSDSSFDVYLSNSEVTLE